MRFDLPKKEKEILKFWKDSRIFQKSLQKRERGPRFVFYDGPITVNARPGIHHVLARIFKDLIPRFKTMQGYYVERKNGWDTHGLPVELEVEQKLGFKSKREIEKYGIEKFNRACKENVKGYIPLFKDLTEKIAYWVDMENPYTTYENWYIESLWWLIKKIWKKGLLYKDFKVVPWCPRCQTTLSSHEVALGYKKIKERAIYVKLKIKNFPKKLKSYLLIWTTTPWTLPGNVAVAVNPKFDYALVKFQNENFILAKERLKILGKDYKVLKNFKGKNLIGVRYEPLFPTLGLKPTAPFYKVLPAGFVKLEEGTGIVHIAPAFGEEDFNLIKSQLPGLKPEILITVSEDGTMKKGIIGEGKFVKEADDLIVKDFKKRGLLFKEELYEHDYPFCWRCRTPLLYYLRKSWFIKMSKLKKKLIANSKKINWIPSHIKEGRFGEWLKEVKDWALSRERYWGTPLPIWECQNCQNLEVIGSKKDLLHQKFSNNCYLLLRHGLAQTNIKRIYSSNKDKYPLTKFGKLQVKRIARKLKKEKIDIIFSSDVLRSLQTAQIIAKELNLKVKIAPEVRDISYGIFEGKPISSYMSFFKSFEEKFYKKPKGGENWIDVKKRIYDFLKKVEKIYQGKKILIVSHDLPIAVLEGAVKGLTFEEFLEYRKKEKIKYAQIRKLDFKIFPYDKEGRLDFHRPYIDEVEFFCKRCKGKMKRVKDVCDVWFDSGAMPFAQYHWPFENKDLIDKGLQYPADYIAEAIDQTRGWFYTLLAISTLIGKGTPFKNVICLGHVLDKKGEKMSKSKGNIIDPWEIIEKYGADALRWYFFTINQPGESKCFNEEDLKKCTRRFFLTLWNCILFWEEYSPNLPLKTYHLKLKNVLDRWIISKLNALVKKVIFNLENYNVLPAAREIEKFAVEDLSKWYIRCSRPRFQRPKSSQELKEASEILGFTLCEFSKLCAPFLPFLSEMIYKKITGKESVHLEDFPEVREKFKDEDLERKMEKVREIVSLGLRERKKVKIKVRQPLLELSIENLNLELDKELLNLIKDQVNVKRVKIKRGKGKLRVSLFLKITPKLKEEGILREIIRILQDMRKKEKLKKEDKIEIFYKGEKNLEKIIEKNKDLIKKITITKKITKIKNPPYLIEKKVILDKGELLLKIKEI